jgi:hypothetical protein
MCNQWRTYPSLDALLKEVKELWEKLKPSKELMEQIEAFNNKKRLQKILEKKGYLEAPCYFCVTRLFIQLAHKQGLGAAKSDGHT